MFRSSFGHTRSHWIAEALMSRTLFRSLLCCGLLVTFSLCHAAPMGFKGSWMMMGDFSAEFQELTFNQALTPRDALGLTAVRMRPDGQRALDNYELSYTRLLQRWNLPHAQANIWFFGGLGETSGGTLAQSRLTVSPGLQADYETTRLYGALNARTYRGEDVNHSVVSARAGFSFYEVDYEQTQPWFIVEARRMSYVSDDIEFTPMLRLIHNRYFIEAGVNTFGKPRLSFMYIF